MVDGPLAIDPDPRKDHHAADRVADGLEPFILFLGAELGRLRSESPSRERGDSRVAGQRELTKVRIVMQVVAAHGVGEREDSRVRQRLAPQELVVPAESEAVRVWIPLRIARRVLPEVERGVDQHREVNTYSIRPR